MKKTKFKIVLIITLIFTIIFMQGNKIVVPYKNQIGQSNIAYAAMADNTGIEAQLSAMLNHEVIGEDGKKLKIVACVIRNTGSGWKQIGGNHIPINVSSVTQDKSKITINYSFKAKNVVSFVAVPDETMAEEDFFMGSSVGLDSANIYITQNKSLGSYVYYNGSTWASKGDNGITATFNNGILTITHSAITGVKVSANCRDGAYIAQVGSLGTTTTQICFYDYSGKLVTTPNTKMKVYWERTSQHQPIDPATYVSSGGNIWVLGVMEVD